MKVTRHEYSKLREEEAEEEEVWKKRCGRGEVDRATREPSFYPISSTQIQPTSINLVSSKRTMLCETQTLVDLSRFHICFAGHSSATLISLWTPFQSSKMKYSNRGGIEDGSTRP